MEQSQFTMTEDMKKIDQELLLESPQTSPSTESPPVYTKKKPEPIVFKRKGYTLERKIKDNDDGTIEVEYVGRYHTIREVGEVLGFTEGKTFNIYQRKNKLAEKIFITKIE